MKTIRIGLLWHSVAAGNLGVGALTVGNIALVRDAARRAGVVPRFTIFAAADKGAPYVFGEDIETRTINGRYMLSPRGYLRDLAGIDYMLDIGAGDSFTDIYPGKRFAYLIATKALALWSGTPLVLAPQTIGPFSRQPHSALAAWVCRRAALVVARDPDSMAALQKLSPSARAQQAIDVAFALPFDPPPPHAAAPIRVGLNVSGLLMSGGYAGGNEYGLGFDYRALTRGLIAAFLAMPAVELHMVPHVLAPGAPNDDDGAAADRLCAEFPAIVRHPDFASPSAAKSFIASLDFLTGARMHATIAAFSAGVPVVPISYSRKFEGLYRGLGYPYLVNAKGMDSATAQAFILDAFHRRDELAGAIAQASPAIERGLETYVAALAGLFGRFAADKG